LPLLYRYSRQLADIEAVAAGNAAGKVEIFFERVYAACFADIRTQATAYALFGVEPYFEI